MPFVQPSPFQSMITFYKKVESRLLCFFWDAQGKTFFSRKKMNSFFPDQNLRAWCWQQLLGFLFRFKATARKIKDCNLEKQRNLGGGQGGRTEPQAEPILSQVSSHSGLPSSRHWARISRTSTNESWWAVRTPAWGKGRLKKRSQDLPPIG